MLEEFKWILIYLFIKVKGGGGALVHVYVWEHIVTLNYRITSKDLNTWKILMNFYLFIEVKKGGFALVHVYVLEHIVSLNYRIARWIFTKLCRDKVLKTPLICIHFWAKSA